MLSHSGFLVSKERDLSKVKVQPGAVAMIHGQKARERWHEKPQEKLAVQESNVVKRL